MVKMPSGLATYYSLDLCRVWIEEKGKQRHDSNSHIPVL
jgi:hypothetical protein